MRHLCIYVYDDDDVIMWHRMCSFFRAENPLQVTSALENQIGKEFQAKILFNGMLRVCCKNRTHYNDARGVGKLVVKVESLIPRGSQQGIKGVVY